MEGENSTIFRYRKLDSAVVLDQICLFMCTGCPPCTGSIGKFAPALCSSQEHPCHLAHRGAGPVMPQPQTKVPMGLEGPCEYPARQLPKTEWEGYFFMETIHEINPWKRVRDTQRMACHIWAQNTAPPSPGSEPALLQAASCLEVFSASLS